MQETNAKVKWLVVAFIWIGIFSALAVGYRFCLAPRMEAKAKNDAVQQHNALLRQTGSKARFDCQVTVNVDSFSGYAVVRSPEFAEECAAKNIGLSVVDDGANYSRRIRDLQAGNCQFSVFTVDALIKASAGLGDLPATMIFIIDESRGADAMYGVKRVFANVDAMNDPNTKFVVTKDSPSETLARVVMARFNLNRLSDEPFIYADGAKEVYARYRKSKPQDKQLFVLWEPYVTKMARNPDYKNIVDSGKFRGYIVDVMAVSRDFLTKNPQLVAEVTQCYFRAAFRHRSMMAHLLVDDSKTTDEPWTLDAAQALLDQNKILFRNTQENYGHFGVAKGTGLQHIEDIIVNLTNVLIKTKAISSDPTAGRPNLLYYKPLLEGMCNAGFHPGATEETVRKDIVLSTLSDDDWDHLEPVGTLEVPDLVFARGTCRITIASEEILTNLAKSLQTWPQYYLSVKGNASTVGNLGANKRLALARAEEVKRWLVRKGIAANRIHAVGGDPSGETKVTFAVGQLPY